MALSIHSIYRRIFKIWRAKRFALFSHYINPRPTDRLIDIGGYPWFWVSHPPVTGSIDCLNIHPVDYDLSPYPNHKMQILVGNGCDLQMADNTYDIAFSNSVIEHVGTWENQQAFARELRRVGSRLWCQTPARECPIEPHYLAPFVHWLPKGVQRRVVRYFTPWGWLSRPSKEAVEEMVTTTRLLTHREMKELFPDCEIIVERLMPGIPKSYIAVRNDRPQPTGGS